MFCDRFHDLRVPVPDQTGHLTGGPVEHAFARCGIKIQTLRAGHDFGEDFAAVGNEVGQGIRVELVVVHGVAHFEMLRLVWSLGNYDVFLG